MRLSFLLFFLVSLTALGQNGDGLRFIENKGQWDADVDFQAVVPGGRVGVSSKGFSIQLFDVESLEHRHLGGHVAVDESSGQEHHEQIESHFFRINFLGANLSTPRASSRFEGYHNYFVGNDSCRWATGANAYATIVYHDIYDGIDLRVSSSAKNLKYDFIVSAESDPSQIQIEYEGVNGVEQISEDLQIKTIVGTVTESKPFTYQKFGTERIVASEYQLDGNVVSFSFPNGYDECRELVIDPLLIFSTFSGSTADNWGSTATPGENGTLYSAGVTRQDLGGAFPTTPGAFQVSSNGLYDMALIKYDSAGTQFLYATHLGGSNNDSPQSLVVDKVSGDLIVLGISSSSNYPTGLNAFDRTYSTGTSIFNRVLSTVDSWDIVLTRFSSDGTQLVGSTFFGGSGNDGLNLPKPDGGLLVANYGDEMRGDVITDEEGNVYISSVTSSNNLSIVNGYDNSFNGGTTDAVVAKFAFDLSSIVWSTYLGGTGLDAAYSIKFDADQNIIVAGGTSSSNFPVTPGAYQTTFKGVVDGWIVRLSPAGNSLLQSTFTGTTSFDQIYFVDLNSTGSIFCYGQTSGFMPVTTGVYRNANSGQFLQKFSSDLSSLQLSTVFGSNSFNGTITPNISPTAFLVNDCDNIYMAGWGGFVNSATGFWPSNTFNMPVTSDAHQSTTSGSDFYFMVLNGDATELVYATYFGGNTSKTHVDGGTSRFDKYGIVYHAVCAGCAFGNATGASSSDFPTTPGARSTVNASSNCNNAAFKFDLSSLNAVLETNNTALTHPGFNNVCFPDSIVFQNFSTGGRDIIWDFGDGTTAIQTSTDPRFVVHQYEEEGQYEVKLKIIDLSTCSQTDSAAKVINYFRPAMSGGDDGKVCEGSNFQLTASGALIYHWISEEEEFSSSLQNPFVAPEAETSYFVTMVDANGCVKTDTLVVDVIDSVDVDWNYELLGRCIGRPSVFVESFSNENVDDQFYVDFGDGTVSSQNEVQHDYQQDGNYTLRFVAERDLCQFVETVQIPVFTLMVPNVFTPEHSPGTNDRFEVVFGEDHLSASEIGLQVQLTVVDRWGKKVFESDDYQNTWDGKDLGGGTYYVQVRVGDIATCKDWVHVVK